MRLHDVAKLSSLQSLISSVQIVFLDLEENMLLRRVTVFPSEVQWRGCLIHETPRISCFASFFYGCGLSCGLLPVLVPLFSCKAAAVHWSVSSLAFSRKLVPPLILTIWKNPRGSRKIPGNFVASAASFIVKVSTACFVSMATGTVLPTRGCAYAPCTFIGPVTAAVTIVA